MFTKFSSIDDMLEKYAQEPQPEQVIPEDVLNKYNVVKQEMGLGSAVRVLLEQLMRTFGISGPQAKQMMDNQMPQIDPEYAEFRAIGAEYILNLIRES